MSQLPSVPFTIPGGAAGNASLIGNPSFTPGGPGSFQAPVGGGQGGAPGGAGGIQGGLPWGGGGGNMFYDLAGSYQQAYNSALQMNQANYNNILRGYQQTQAAQTGAQQAIGAGYNQLYNTVMGGIQGIGQAQAQNIADVYAQQSGAQAQMLTNRGLGNTTVAESVQRGLTLDQQKAQIGLANQLAQLQAGYASQLGGAALNYQNQAAMQNTALANQQLQWMNSVQAQYPNAQAYTNLLQQQGAIEQANADRALLQQQLNRLNPYAGSFGRGGGFGGFMGTRGQTMSGGSIGGVGPAGMPPPPVTGPGMIRQRGLDPGTGMATSGEPTAADYAAYQQATGYGHPTPADYAAYGHDVAGIPGAPTAADLEQQQYDLGYGEPTADDYGSFGD